MTVCIAAIYMGQSIVGVADRMLTSGEDIEFQPEQSKLYQVTNSIVAMISGDMTLQTEIYLQLLKARTARLQSNPDDWLPVKDVVDDYCRIYGEIKQQRGRRDFLTPLGLDHDSFIARHQQLQPDIARQLTVDLISYEMPAASVVFAGIDDEGAHLYVVHDGRYSCQDMVGFAAVGSGASVAQSAFMFNRYTRFATPARALYLTYAAKKRSESVAAVGPETDFFVIGPNPGTYNSIHPGIMGDVMKIWERHQKRSEKSWKSTEREVDECILRINRQKTATDQQSAPGPSNEPQSSATNAADSGGEGTAGGEQREPAKKPEESP